MDNTVILFASDHGEELCDHHMFRKCRPYEGSSHIPMILSGPESLIGGRKGQVCSGIVELRDVMPTFLDLAHAPVPCEVDGKSLLPLVRDPGKSVREWLHGEHLIDIRIVHRDKTGQIYLVFSDGRGTVFSSG